MDSSADCATQKSTRASSTLYIECIYIMINNEHPNKKNCYIYLKIFDSTIYNFQNTIYTSSFLLKIPSKKIPPAAGRYIYHILYYIPQNLDFHYIYFANIYVYTIYTHTLSEMLNFLLRD